MKAEIRSFLKVQILAILIYSSNFVLNATNNKLLNEN